MLTHLIIPYLNNKDEKTIGATLNSFRDDYVWVTKVNTILELNLEGIMDIFTKYSEEIGFTIESAFKVLKGIGCLLSHR